jgi:hypothetical protein
MANISATAGTIVKVLSQITTISVVTEFLKSKSLTSSASGWKELEEKRILPAIDSGKLSLDELMKLLSSSEEHGRQHVFLFKTSPKTAATLFDETKIREGLQKNGAETVIDEPRFLDEPEEMKISEVRINDEYILIKFIETKISMTQVGMETEGNILKKIYEIHKERGVNILKLHRDGLLEIRIGSHRSSGGYAKALKAFETIANDFFPMTSFAYLSVSKLKSNLWDKREELEGKIRFTNWTLKNDYGNSLQASSSSVKDDLRSDKGLQSSLETFIESDAYCDSTNLYFLKSDENSLPSAEIHVLLTGESNEFAITKHCDKEDYEYVLSEIRKLNI